MLNICHTKDHKKYEIKLLMHQAIFVQYFWNPLHKSYSTIELYAQQFQY